MRNKKKIAVPTSWVVRAKWANTCQAWEQRLLQNPFQHLLTSCHHDGFDGLLSLCLLFSSSLLLTFLSLIPSPVVKSRIMHRAGAPPNSPPEWAAMSSFSRSGKERLTRCSASPWVTGWRLAPGPAHCSLSSASCTISYISVLMPQLSVYSRSLQCCDAWLLSDSYLLSFLLNLLLFLWSSFSDWPHRSSIS